MLLVRKPRKLALFGCGGFRQYIWSMIMATQARSQMEMVTQLPLPRDELQILVRKAEPQDFQKVLEMYMDGLKELGEDRINQKLCLDKIITSYYLAPCFLLVKNDTIIGMSGLTIGTSSHNGDATLLDYMFYVQPEHRALKNLSCLINSIKEFALQNNLPVKLEFLAQDNPKTRERLFTMHGFDVHSVTGVFNDGKKRLG